MSQRFVVEGGVPLKGSLTISGAKNAAIKMIAAALLTDEEVVLENVPEIKDVEVVKSIARSLGVKVFEPLPSRLVLKADAVSATAIPRPLGLPSRSSVIFMGPLLARFGKASFPEPGGDRIGKRPINRHIKALEILGAKVSFADGVYTAEAPHLLGNTVKFEEVTVMGTENTLLAASLASGETTILNAALEPEIDDLILMLNKMGAKIERKEARVIKVEGVNRLGGVTHGIVPDRNELATFAIAAAVTRGDVTLERVRPRDVTALLAKLERTGVSFEAGKDSLHLWAESGAAFRPVTIETAPHPGFMTDWQQPFCVLLTQADGVSFIHETIHLSRFGYAMELNRMGAKIELLTPAEAGFVAKVSDDGYDLAERGEPRTVAKITGPTSLRGRRLQIPDLRAGATLVIAALAASGRSEIMGVEHIDRGYSDFDGKLRALGAEIERV